MAIQYQEKSLHTLQHIFPMSISETDCTHLIKPVVIFNCMQDLAEKSIARYSQEYSCEALAQKGLGWYIIRYRIEFDKYNPDIKELKIKTEFRGCQKLNTYRDFEVYDNKTGDCILRATSYWLIVDLDNKSIVNISQEFPEMMKFEKREDDLILQKLKSFDSPDFEKEFDVRFDDLDINNHVNNTIYIAWALEALNYDFRTNHKLKTLDVYFKHEAKYGDTILSQVKFDTENPITHHVIKNKETNEELCLLKATFE